MAARSHGVSLLLAFLVAACGSSSPAGDGGDVGPTGPPRDGGSDGDPDGAIPSCRDACGLEGDQTCSGHEIGTCVRGDDGCLRWSFSLSCIGPFNYCRWTASGVDCVYAPPAPSPGDCWADGELRCDEGLVQRCSGPSDSEHPGSYETLVDCSAYGLECVAESPLSFVAGPLCGGACDAVAGTGCGEGEKCGVLVLGWERSEAFGCVPWDVAAGSTPAGPCAFLSDPSGFQFDDCPPGYFCAPHPVDGGEVCLRVTGPECAECIDAYPDDAGELTVPGFCEASGLCMPAPAGRCDLLCQDCPLGQRCVRRRLSDGSVRDECRFSGDVPCGGYDRVGDECLDLCDLTDLRACLRGGCSIPSQHCTPDEPGSREDLLPPAEGIGLCVS